MSCDALEHQTWQRLPGRDMYVCVCMQSLFPPDLAENERIRAQLTSALNMMNHAVDGRSLPAWQQAHMEAQPQAGPSQAHGGYTAPGPAAPIAHQYTAAAEELTLRQLVESFAAENDIRLLPKAGQMEEGLQVTFEILCDDFLLVMSKVMSGDLYMYPGLDRNIQGVLTAIQRTAELQAGTMPMCKQHRTVCLHSC